MRSTSILTTCLAPFKSWRTSSIISDFVEVQKWAGEKGGGWVGGGDETLNQFLLFLLLRRGWERERPRSDFPWIIQLQSFDRFGPEPQVIDSASFTSIDKLPTRNSSDQQSWGNIFFLKILKKPNQWITRNVPHFPHSKVIGAAGGHVTAVDAAAIGRLDVTWPDQVLKSLKYSYLT